MWNLLSSALRGNSEFIWIRMKSGKGTSTECILEVVASPKGEVDAYTQ